MPEQLNDRLLSWAPDIEPGARAQAERTSRLPFIAGHVALMADAHYGLGATIGSVIPTRDAIIPAAVGVDIGCGMIAARLDLTSHELPDDLQPLHRSIASAIPAGLGRGHRHAAPILTIVPWDGDMPGLLKDDGDLQRRASLQLGSLGSGNHFLEVCLDEADRVWLVLHSGSRGVGNLLASRHIATARGLMKEWLIELEDRDLAYLPASTPEFDAYIGDMQWAQRYAMRNRSEMLRLALEAIAAFLRRQVVIADQINCHHNFTQLEEHSGDQVWITRKGAIKAAVGDRGVIPGSMGTRSYIVSGLGSTASYCSCAHGAGRRLGRREAKRRLTAESLREAMAGKVWNGDADALLDEHPLAYKDIDEVMEHQRDLVTVEHTLHQILNYKGT